MITRKQAIGTALVLGALALVPALFPGYFTSLATLMLIYAMLAMSVDLLAGYAGRTPLCHGAIFGTAAYVVMYFVTTVGGNPWLALPLGTAGGGGGGCGVRGAGGAHQWGVLSAADAGAGHDRLGRVPALDLGHRRRERPARQRAPGLAGRPGLSSTTSCSRSAWPPPA